MIAQQEDAANGVDTLLLAFLGQPLHDAVAMRPAGTVITQHDDDAVGDRMPPLVLFDFMEHALKRIVIAMHIPDRVDAGIGRRRGAPKDAY